MALLDLKAELGRRGEAVTFTSPDLVPLLLAQPDRLAAAAGLAPYTELVAGLRLGFQAGAKPSLHLEPGQPGLRIVLDRPVRSTWLTLELDWPRAVFAEKRQLSLQVAGMARGGAELLCLLWQARDDGTGTDIASASLRLAPHPGRQLVRLGLDERDVLGEGSLRLLLFLPLQPFDLTLTELIMA